MNTLMVKKLTQVLGLSKDAASVPPSICSNTNRHCEVADHDRHILNMLNDLRILAGMTQGSAISNDWVILD